jgi:uncharacterized protein (DUF849 family)
MTTPVIIEAAINGATTKDRNPHVPVSPGEIASDARACLEAGAAIIHNHIDRSGLSGADAAERYLEAWRPVLAARPDALWYPTVNFGRGGSFSYDHLAPLAATGQLRMSLADPGSVNLGRFENGVPVGAYAYVNTFDAVAHQFDLARTLGLGPSVAIYEPGFLRVVLRYHGAGLLPRGTMVKLYLCDERGAFGGATFGLPPTVPALDAYLDLLEGTGIPWAVSVAGGDVVASEVGRVALDRGGHVHLGLEFFGGDRQPTNVELVREAVDLCRAAGRAVATCDEAAQILDLPAR